MAASARFMRSQAGSVFPVPRIARGPLSPPAPCSFSSLLPSPPRCPGTPLIAGFPGFPRPAELWLPQPSVLLPLLSDVLSRLMSPALPFALPASPAWYALALPAQCPPARSPPAPARCPPQPQVFCLSPISLPPNLVSPLSSQCPPSPVSHPSYSHLSPSSSRLE